MTLKPCPFCGSTKVRVMGSMYAYVRCDECWALGPNIRPKDDDLSNKDMREAERLWNERS